MDKQKPLFSIMSKWNMGKGTTGNQFNQRFDVYNDKLVYVKKPKFLGLFGTAQTINIPYDTIKQVEIPTNFQGSLLSKLAHPSKCFFKVTTTNGEEYLVSNTFPVITQKAREIVEMRRNGQNIEKQANELMKWVKNPTLSL